MPNDRQRAARRRAKGLCIDCGAPVADGRARCPEHLARNRDYQRESRRMLGIGQGCLCSLCGTRGHNRRTCDLAYDEKEDAA